MDELDKFVMSIAVLSLWMGAACAIWIGISDLHGGKTDEGTVALTIGIGFAGIGFVLGSLFLLRKKRIHTPIHKIIGSSSVTSEAMKESARASAEKKKLKEQRNKAQEDRKYREKIERLAESELSRLTPTIMERIHRAAKEGATEVGLPTGWHSDATELDMMAEMYRKLKPELEAKGFALRHEIIHSVSNGPPSLPTSNLIVSWK